MAIRASAADPASGNPFGVGWHFCVVDAVDQTDKEGKPFSDDKGNAQLCVKLRCLASSNPADVGRVRFDYQPFQGDRAWVFWQFMVAVGLTTVEEQAAAHQSGEETEVEETEAVGMFLCVRVELGKPYTDRNGKQQEPKPQIAGRYHVFSPDAKECPKHEPSMELLKKAGITSMPGAKETAASSAADAF